MERVVFGFMINSKHPLMQLHKDGEYVQPWTSIVAEKCGVKAPGPEASNADWSKYEREVEDCVLKHGCFIVPRRVGVGLSYYVFTLSCQFGMDPDKSPSDIRRIQEVMRDDLCVTLHKFCRLMDIPWQDPDWLALRGQQIRKIDNYRPNN